MKDMKSMMEHQTLFFHALSNDIRMRIVLLLADEPQLSVCQLVRILGLPQPKVSRHLAVLRDAGIVSVDRRAQWICYSLGETLAPWQREVVNVTRESVKDADWYQEDHRRLQEVRRLMLLKNHPCAPAGRNTEEAVA